MAGVGFSSEDKDREGRERWPTPDLERPAEESGLLRPKQSKAKWSRESPQLLSRLNPDRTQAAIILCGFYLLLSGRKLYKMKYFIYSNSLPYLVKERPASMSRYRALKRSIK